ncbi:MAG: histidine phosphatase family protein [Patescibacteria group bacterium]
MQLNNKYFILRHGEALSNLRKVTSSWPETFENHLTEKGVEMIKEAAEKLKKENIDLIISSDLLRTKETAEIVGNALDITPQFDERLREINFGTMNGGPISELDIKFRNEAERITDKMEKGESYQDVWKRVSDFLNEMELKYKNEDILVISHECPLWILESIIKSMSLEENLKRIKRDERIHKGQVKELN